MKRTIIVTVVAFAIAVVITQSFQAGLTFIVGGIVGALANKFCVV